MGVKYSLVTAIALSLIMAERAFQREAIDAAIISSCVLGRPTYIYLEPYFLFKVVEMAKKLGFF